MSSQKAKITKREKKSQERQKKLDKLSKIINGGDFGDATGLVMSVMPDQE